MAEASKEEAALLAGAEDMEVEEVDEQKEKELLDGEEKTTKGTKEEDQKADSGEAQVRKTEKGKKKNEKGKEYFRDKAEAVKEEMEGLTVELVEWMQELDKKPRVDEVEDVEHLLENRKNKFNAAYLSLCNMVKQREENWKKEKEQQEAGWRILCDTLEVEESEEVADKLLKWKEDRRKMALLAETRSDKAVDTLQLLVTSLKERVQELERNEHVIQVNGPENEKERREIEKKQREIEEKWKEMEYREQEGRRREEELQSQLHDAREAAKRAEQEEERALHTASKRHKKIKQLEKELSETRAQLEATTNNLTVATEGEKEEVKGNKWTLFAERIRNSASKKDMLKEMGASEQPKTIELQQENTRRRKGNDSSGGGLSREQRRTERTKTDGEYGQEKSERSDELDHLVRDYKEGLAKRKRDYWEDYENRVERMRAESDNERDWRGEREGDRISEEAGSLFSGRSGGSEKLAAVLKTMGMPQLQAFNGRKEDWARFETGFMLRYGSMEGREAVSLLGEFLRGQALDDYYNRPKDIKYDLSKCLKYLEGRLGNNTPFSKLEKEERLMNLKIGNRGVGAFCDELERLTASLYDRNDWERMRTRALMRESKGRKEYAEMMSMYQTWGEEGYEMMKELMLRMEYIERQLKGGSGQQGIRSSVAFEQNRGQSLGIGRGRIVNTYECYKCGGKGHTAVRCTVNTGHMRQQMAGGQNMMRPQVFNNQRGVVASGRGSWSSRGTSNVASMSRPVPFTNTSSTRGGYQEAGSPMRGNQYMMRGRYQRGGRGGGVHTVESLKVEKRMDEEKEEEVFVARRFIVEGEIGGVQEQILLDTGADVSIVSERVLEIMKGRGEQVEVLRGGSNLQNASYQKMDVVGRCTLEVKLKGSDKKTVVGFHIVRGRKTESLIGMNALPKMNVLSIRDFGKEEDVRKGEDAVVSKAIKVKPRSTAMIKVKGTSEEERVLWIESEKIGKEVYGTEGRSVVEIPVTNRSRKTMKFREGEKLGEWLKVRRDRECQANIILLGPEREEVPLSREKKVLAVLEEKRGAKMDDALKRVIEEHHEVFALEDTELGRSKEGKCVINTGQSLPIKQRARPVPFSLREPLHKLLTRMESQGVIRESESPWSSPVVLVKKKDGSIRLCIDYRKLNNVVTHDAHPLPNIDDTLMGLEGKKVFSVVDMQSGYWQLVLDEGSIAKTAFSTLERHYEFTVLPFGLTTAPAVFQRVMQKVLAKFLKETGRKRQVFVYIDDVLVATETMQEHAEVLNEVIQKFKEVGLRMNAKKCMIAVDSVAYLGHVITGGGIAMDEEKVRAIKQFPQPRNVAELRTFLGMAGYYRKYILSFAKVVSPLTKLVSPKVKWEWGKKQEEAFSELKERMTSAPILAQPDYEAALKGERPFVITTDACKEGIGGVLSQEGKDGKEHPISFFSRATREAEKKYAISDLEALAMHACVIKWKHFVLGMVTEVRTDHQPLTALLTRMNVSPRVLRWIQDLLPYKLKIKYVKGTENRVADALSRAPLREIEQEEEGEQGIDQVINAVGIEEEESSEWKEGLAKDTWAVKLMARVKNSEGNEVKQNERVYIPEVQRKVNVSDFKVDNGILYLLGPGDEERAYVPESMREKITKRLHESVVTGHVGSEKLLKMMEKKVYWGAMRRDIPRVVRSCLKCAICNSQKKLIPPLQPRTADGPMELVGVDLVDMGGSTSGERYILTVVDAFTKLGGGYALRDKKAESVAKVFMNRWVLEGGRVPRKLQSDNGSEFVNEVMKEICTLFELERQTTLPYHSRANGLTERYNRTIEGILKKLVVNGGEWDEALPYAIYSYNNSPHNVTGESPFFLAYGRDEPVPLGGIPRRESGYTWEVDEYKERVVKMTERMKGIIRERLKEERERMKKQYDEKHKNNMQRLPRVGDRVYLREETEKGMAKNPKLAIEWRGPFRVIRVSQTTATIKAIHDEGEERVVQFDRLRLVPVEVDNTEVVTRTGGGKGKRGRPKKVTEVEYTGRQMCDIDRSEDEIVLGAAHRLHPNGRCEDCGEDGVAAAMLYPIEGADGDVRIRTMRELWEIVKMSKEDPHKSTQTAFERVVRRQKWKKMEMDESVAEMYGGMCEHRVQDLIEMKRKKISLVELDEKVGRRIAEKLSQMAQEMGEPEEKGRNVLLGSILWKKLHSPFRVLDVAVYEDEDELRELLEALKAEKAGVLILFLDWNFDRERIVRIIRRVQSLAGRGWKCTVSPEMDRMEDDERREKLADLLELLEEGRKELEKCSEGLRICTHKRELVGGTIPIFALTGRGKVWEDTESIERGIREIVSECTDRRGHGWEEENEDMRRNGTEEVKKEVEGYEETQKGEVDVEKKKKEGNDKTGKKEGERWGGMMKRGSIKKTHYNARSMFPKKQYNNKTMQHWNKCFVCGGTGHMARFCPNANRQ